MIGYGYLGAMFAMHNLESLQVGFVSMILGSSKFSKNFSEGGNGIVQLR